MKYFFKRLAVTTYMIGSIFVLMFALVYPLGLSLDTKSINTWPCWILWGLSAIIISSMNQVMEIGDNLDEQI